MSSQSAASVALETSPETMDKQQDEEEEQKQASLSLLLPMRMISTVVPGLGRGSTDLGIPTANLCVDAGILQLSHPNFQLEDIPTGIYWGYCRMIPPSSTGTAMDDRRTILYTTAVSVGYNPTYGNTFKTIEPHVIAPEHDPARHASSCGETAFTPSNCFHNATCRLSLVGYLRPELPFDGLDALTAAIRQDIAHAVQYAALESSGTSAASATAAALHDESHPNHVELQKKVTERDWVQSDLPLVVVDRLS